MRESERPGEHSTVSSGLADDCPSVFLAGFQRYIVFGEQHAALDSLVTLQFVPTKGHLGGGEEAATGKTVERRFMDLNLDPVVAYTCLGVVVRPGCRADLKQENNLDQQRPKYFHAPWNTACTEAIESQ